MYKLETFYQNRDWIGLLACIKDDRTQPDGMLYCEHCGKPIVKKYDCIGHHTIFLNEDNVNDTSISLNPKLIQLVHHRCHNLIHNKLGSTRKEIFLIYGSPLSGKSTYAETVREPGDLVIDMDSIWQCISGCPRYVKPNRLRANVFSLRDELIRQVKVRFGKWNNAYIIGGYPLISERERLCRELGAREIFIETEKEECLKRLEALDDRDKTEWKKYIEEWWRRYAPTKVEN